LFDGGKPGVDSRDEGKHTGRNDLLFIEKMMWMDERVDTCPMVAGSTEPCIPLVSLNRVPALLGVKAGMSSLPDDR